MNSNLAYQEDRWEELIDGEIVMMAPASSNHNRIAGNLYRIFSNYLYGKTYEPFADGEDVYLTDGERFVPDFMVICDPEKVKKNGIYGAPDLVAEVLSPSTARNDKKHKKDVYARCGVREYWLIHPEDKSVEVYHLSGKDFFLYDIYSLHPDWMLAQMPEERRAAVVTHFKCSLFEDLDISLEDIFYRTF